MSGHGVWTCLDMVSGHVWTCLDMVSGHGVWTWLHMAAHGWTLHTLGHFSHLLFMHTVHTCCSQAYQAALQANEDLESLPEAFRKTIIRGYKEMLKNKSRASDVFLDCVICQGRTLNVRASPGSWYIGFFIGRLVRVCYCGVSVYGPCSLHVSFGAVACEFALVVSR